MGPKQRNFTEEVDSCIAKIELTFKRIEVVKNSARAEIEAHKMTSLPEMIDKLKQLKTIINQTVDSVVDLKFQKGDDAEEILEWEGKQSERLKVYTDFAAEIEQFRLQNNKTPQRTDGEEKGSHEKQADLHMEMMRQQKEWMMEQQTSMYKQMEELWSQRMEREDAWYEKRMKMEETVKRDIGRQQTDLRQQSVKLQKYTITKFNGDYKDWLRFWNQFTVEVDGSSLPEISKFNYLLELVEGQPKDDILGLPHNEDGYKEAKKILEENYGKDIKVHKALIMELETLPQITTTKNVREVHDFNNKMARVVRTLKTMKKLDSAEAHVYSILNKLGPVRQLMTQKDDSWESWGLTELSENLKKYVDRNPINISTISDEKPSFNNKKAKSPWQPTNKEEARVPDNGSNRSSQGSSKPQRCVYCGLSNHPSYRCMKVLDVKSRRDILLKKKLCYNCLRPDHVASSCRNRGCFKCNQRHHSSLCTDETSTLGAQPTGQRENMGAVPERRQTLHPTVVAEANGEDVRIMLDSGAGSSYVCTDLLTKLNLKPIRKEKRVIEQMFGTVTKNVELYKINLKSKIYDDFSIDVECINAEKDILTELPNPKVSEIKKRYNQLRRLQFTNDDDSQDLQPIHIMFSAADYQRIKTTEPQILGPNPDIDPGAELTTLGWTLTGKSVLNDSGISKEFLITTGQDQFERMCSLEVLGIQDAVESDDSFHEHFKEQLEKKEDGYHTRLPWKEDRMELPTNKILAEKRLQSTTNRLKRIGKFQEYNTIMQDQLESGILEEVPSKPTGDVVHYIPHQGVIREEAESTKLRVVYDCSAKPNKQIPSLNDCLEVGPPLQPLLFDILLRNRMKKFCILADIQKAFLQIKIDERDRDAQRLLWYNSDNIIKEYRFTRVIFGAGPSPYILGATLEKHLEQYKESPFEKTISSLKRDTYVDDLQCGSNNEEDLHQFKKESKEIMADGGFKLHKWHSNIEALEEVPIQSQNQMVNKSTNDTTRCTRILGIPWDKTKDELSIKFDQCVAVGSKAPVTKRKMISAINSVFDVLGITSPIMIIGRLLFSQTCLKKLRWDEHIPEEIYKPWMKWIQSLKQSIISIPRAIVTCDSAKVVLHGFSDASKLAICAVIYLVVMITNKPSQANLLVSKTKIAPKESIPRLELVAALLLTKLIKSVRRAVQNVQQINETHAWVDSTTALYWIQEKGSFSKYVRNRAQKIRKEEGIVWAFVPGKENPSDLGTRGASPEKLASSWFYGPEWLTSKEKWPKQPDIVETEECKDERVAPKEIACLVKEQGEVTGNSLRPMMEKFSYWKLIRVTSYIQRFIYNCRNPQTRLTGPLTTIETQKAEMYWLTNAQESITNVQNISLKQDKDGIWRLDGRVPNYNPAYLPRTEKLAELIIRHHHERSLHGGVSSTMTSVRQRFWIPKLRVMVKKTIHKCNRCKKYRIKPLKAPEVAKLPSYRVNSAEPFRVTGVDFAGPMLYKTEEGLLNKCYISLFTCAAIRAVHLKLCKDLSAPEFQRALKEFAARRGPPQMMVSDNAKTFVATGEWLKTLKKDEKLMNYLAENQITWRFNLARAPWWGGMFERLIGIMKTSLSKTIGRGLLKFEELEEVLLDVECNMNNRPLTYLEEDVNEVLTPNILLRGKPAVLLEEDLENMDETDFTKRLRFLKRCKSDLNKRWMNEYVRCLTERENKDDGQNKKIPDVGSIVLLKEDVKDKSKLRTGKIVKNVKGQDGVVRGYKIRLGNGYIVERPLQMVCDLEMRADIGTKDRVQPNVVEETEERPTRPTRKAKEDAKKKIKTVYEQENIEE